MNIILTSVHIHHSPDALPLAPALLKSYIDKYKENLDLNIEIIETTLGEGFKKFADNILLKQPDILGLSVYLWNRKFYEELVVYIKNKAPKIKILAGGPEIRSDYRGLLDIGVDYTLQGEGEKVIYETIKKLYKNEDPSSLDGVNDDISQFIYDLDSIPSPLVNRTLKLEKYDGLLWELSRGCPFKCDFCFESRGSNGVRYYNFERVEAELNVILESEISQVFVLDPTFNKDLVRAKKILNLIKKKNKKGIHFHFEVRAELLDREIAKLFSEIGASLQIGIQSGNDDVLKNVNRRINRKLFTEKISLLNYYGATFGLDLIFGLPGDTYNGFKESMRYVISLQPNHLDIFPLAVLPGTNLCDNYEKFGIKYNKKPPYIVEYNDTFSIDDMKKSYDLKKGCDFIYNKCRSTGWLLQVCNELKVGTIEFIEGIYKDINSNNLKIEKLGVDYIKKYISLNFKPKNIKLIKNIIEYHTACSDASINEKSTSSKNVKDLKKSKVSLSKTATFLKFDYPLLDAFDYEMYTIKDIKQNVKPMKQDVIIWYHTGGFISEEIYDKQIMSFLSKINGELRPNDIDSNIDVEFLKFAQDSGLLLFS